MTCACLNVASSCILPSSITVPVPSPMASMIRFAVLTSSTGGLNSRLAMSIWLGCSVQAPTQPIKKAALN